MRLETPDVAFEPPVGLDRRGWNWNGTNVVATALCVCAATLALAQLSGTTGADSLLTPVASALPADAIVGVKPTAVSTNGDGVTDAVVIVVGVELSVVALTPSAVAVHAPRP